MATATDARLRQVMGSWNWAAGTPCSTQSCCVVRLEKERSGGRWRRRRREVRHRRLVSGVECGRRMLWRVTALATRESEAYL